eukprot:3523-Heterococcus_DN1.PRE.1
MAPAALTTGAATATEWRAMLCTGTKRRNHRSELLPTTTLDHDQTPPYNTYCHSALQRCGIFVRADCNTT